MDQYVGARARRHDLDPPLGDNLTRTATLVTRALPGPRTTIRPATIADWPDILAMRAAYYDELDPSIVPAPLSRDLTNCVWHVAERAGRVTCCMSWKDYDGGARYAFDFFRVSGYGATIDFVRMARWATRKAEADGVELVVTVDVRNASYREALEMTGQWEAASIVYRRKRQAPSP